MRIVIGADHGGFQLKEEIVEYLVSKGHSVSDQGARTPDAVDYPDVAFKVSETVAHSKAELGILICGTGIGMSNAAGKVRGIIPALCTDEYMARMARKHNEANVLCMGGRVIGPELAKAIVDAFLEGVPLTDDRYIRRREKITNYERALQL